MATMQPNDERTELLHTLAELQTELEHVLAELASTCARISADYKHTFTLHFARGQVARLVVYDAKNHEQAYTLARTLFKPVEYSAIDGDQTQGQAHTFTYQAS